MVLAVGLGDRPSGCYDVAIARVGSVDGALVVDATETTPGPGCICTAAMTHPFFAAAVPRSEAPVRFELRASPAPACR